mmetsp:Transcript_29445/g.61936  ORF Transcript_29445/g.61936 Transcript_29445/m.61936 type:complete len:208 (+) Transcript_29445:60-683(+)
MDYNQDQESAETLVPSLPNPHCTLLSMETSDTSGLDDEFFGDQSSLCDVNSTTNESVTRIQNELPSQPYGNAASHEYRSLAANLKKMSYLDGYDETKDDCLQDGFSDGYRKSFCDAFRVGLKLGAFCGKKALTKSFNSGRSNKQLGGDIGVKDNSVECVASLVRRFLTNEIMEGSSDDGNAEISYQRALLKLEQDIQEESSEICGSH